MDFECLWFCPAHLPFFPCHYALLEEMEDSHGTFFRRIEASSQENGIHMSLLHAWLVLSANR
jgi:hypothetical protein